MTRVLRCTFWLICWIWQDFVRPRVVGSNFRCGGGIALRLVFVSSSEYSLGLFGSVGIGLALSGPRVGCGCFSTGFG